MLQLAQHIESLIFASERPITKTEIIQCLSALFPGLFTGPDVEDALASLQSRYAREAFAFEIVEIGGGYQFLTKGDYHKTLETHLKLTGRKKLSLAALETLSIIAYKQPVSKSEIEQIRGVGSDYAIQKLLEKEIVAIDGRSDAPGRPLLYSTSAKFMDYFGVKSLNDLPKLKDFKEPDGAIGEPQA